MRSILCALPLLLAACVTPVEPDYIAYLAHPPRSILVLPPLDETVEVDACYGALSTLTHPLAEHGYYVFPVAVVDAMMRANGLPTAWEMHQVPLAKLKEIFDPDAVLYVTVTDWGTSFEGLRSATQVTLDARLVDVETGIELWHGVGAHEYASGGGGGDLLGALTSAIVHQVSTSIDDPSRNVSMTASDHLVRSRSHLLPGPYHPEHEATLAEVQTRTEERAAEPTP